MGRTAHGVKGITLVGDDYVVGVAVVEEEKMLITVTEKGYGKRNGFDGYTAHSRGTTGVLCHKLTEKTGKLAGIATVSEDDDIMMITNTGTVVRIHANEIPSYSRTATGVIVMGLSEGSYINNITRLEKEEKIEEESRAIDEEIKSEEAEKPATAPTAERALIESDEESF